MAAFVFELPTQTPSEMGIQSYALGVDGDNPLTQNDLGKAVKLSDSNTVVQCAKDDEMEGILDSLSPETVNSGYGLGGVQRRGFCYAIVGASELGTVAVGELVVVDTQAAVGTANTSNLPLVYPGSPSNHKWRVHSILSGTGAAGDKILLERL